MIPCLIPAIAVVGDALHALALAVVIAWQTRGWRGWAGITRAWRRSTP